ncbi:serine hydrolase domain-containing protein [Agrobacterium tumefaciens]|uniref:serine hydrolase domain-containing protein n=1 Tax=Agrobacterium tumefaciens TaxID=358 RepID=UPI001573AB9E|nr:serine hydrolase [Agrobacterium tumefaciens]
MSGTSIPQGSSTDGSSTKGILIADPRLGPVIELVSKWETHLPEDIASFKLDENLVEYEEGEHGRLAGPLPPRGPATGLVLHRGEVAGYWGEPGRADTAFSVTKGALSVLTGLALSRGLIASLDDAIHKSVDMETFSEAPNRAVTWRHLLTMTSEWRGALWGIPDSIDWNRAVPKRPDAPKKGTPRQTFEPGHYWEFNDVRVNVLALALTAVFRENLEDVFRREIMQPAGASDDWRWHGYDTSSIEIDGRAVPVVAGGGHWGGGLIIPAFDLARLALLHARQGVFNDQTILPRTWFQQVAVPSSLNSSFGLMWWTNANGVIPGLSDEAIWGSGISNLVVADPAKDLVVVLRWYDVARRDDILGRIAEALDDG